MEYRLCYGLGEVIRLELREASVLACPAEAEGAAVAVDDLVRHALTHPLHYPSIELAIAPGDRVAIVPDASLPDAAEVLAAIVQELVTDGVEPCHIHVLATSSDEETPGEGFRERLPREIAERVRVVRHDPANSRELALLAHTEDGEPVVLNRVLTEVDLVLPVGVFRGRLMPDYHGLHHSLFPRFSDTRSGKPFHSPKLLVDPRGRANRRLSKLVDEVANLLGLQFTIQLIPGPRGHVRHCVAGRIDAVRSECNRLYRRLWEVEVPRRAPLVVTSIEGDASQQTWANLARTLSAARELVRPHGTIVVCCDIERPPSGRSLQMMRSAASREEALAWIEAHQPDDALAALQIAEAVEQANVHLMSRLDDELVEQLDMIPVTDVADLNRLASRFDSCIVVENGPMASAVLVEVE